MLEGLDHVDWSGVEHAYGPATDVPGWIRSIAADTKRGKAFTTFVNAVNHQEWITPAAAPAAPFLVELVRARKGPVADLTKLVGDLAAAGDHANVLAGGYDPPSSEPTLVAIRHAVAAGLDDYVALLDDPDPARRAAACIPLVVLEEHAAASLAGLRAAEARETKGEPLACILLAMAWLGTRTGDRADLARVEARREHRAGVVRAAATIATAWLDPEKDHVDRLVAGLAGMRMPFKIPFVGGGLRALASNLVAGALVGAGDVDRLLALEREHELFGITHLIELALAAAMPEVRACPDEPLLASDLSPRAREVATRLIAHVEELRRQNIGVSIDAFWRRGMPAPTRLLGVAPAGPLDELVNGEPLWRHARRARDGRAPITTWSEAIDRWAADDRSRREALAADVHANGHTLSLPHPHRHGEPLRLRWEIGARHGRVVAAALDGLEAPFLASLIRPTYAPSGHAVAAWVRALGGTLDDEARAVVRKVLASPIEEPSAGRAVLEALGEHEREALADVIGFDVLATSVLESPPAVYLRGGFHWVDLSPALTRRLVAEVASWERVPGTEDSPSLAPAAEEATAAALARGVDAAKAVGEALVDARPVGRRILERVRAMLAAA